ncbi:hypothetical protein K435DRAFT_811003 [Dendrothele bispora CBS 962.96]|uniref:Helicase ATP-binding domain-containing protein n=1 Tax=Dendrothele bispora (strain CBS 962.96) TaxID=1314807 RepID=A0A4S8KTQ5_DENBC|nr:hypothetical protein K435DRAFT_811003 [Dendrothele bispora CBS 962.96]
MLTILNDLAKYRDEETGSFNLDALKIVYIAPMKALVQEMVRNFTARLKVFDIKAVNSQVTPKRPNNKSPRPKLSSPPPENGTSSLERAPTPVTPTSSVSLSSIFFMTSVTSVDPSLKTNEYVRLVGLSATLPNKGVATFLRVDEFKGPRRIKRDQVMNEVCYEKVLDQTLVFVHSRKDTAKTAKFLRDMAMEKETITQFVRADGATREILQEEAGNVKDPNLRDLLPFGFAIHHAVMGLLRNSLRTVPYNFVSKLADNLNAEIVLGTIKNRDEAVQWLGYTYLYVRMLKDPVLYSVGVDYLEDDPSLIQKRADIVHAAVLLEKCQLVKYDRCNRKIPKVFALSKEIKLIPEEKLELGKLLERVPITVKESVGEPNLFLDVLFLYTNKFSSVDSWIPLVDIRFVFPISHEGRGNKEQEQKEEQEKAEEEEELKGRVGRKSRLKRAAMRCGWKIEEVKVKMKVVENVDSRSFNRPT